MEWDIRKHGGGLTDPDAFRNKKLQSVRSIPDLENHTFPIPLHVAHITLLHLG